MVRIALVLLVLGTGALLLVPTVFGAASGASAVGNPAASGTSCSVSAGGPAAAATVDGTDLSPDQMRNAQVIVAVVKARRLPQPAAQIALMTAMQESALTVVDHGDAAGPDSRGLFQQRDSWGLLSVRMDAAKSTGLFLDRLVAVPGWATMDPVTAAHAVQRNANAEDYRKWVPFSQALSGALVTNDPSQVTCTGGTLLPGASANAHATVALKAAASTLGMPYCFDGGDSRGPTHGGGGSGCDGATVGFDCSGLALYAWAQAGVNLPHFSGDQYQMGHKVPVTAARPGDLVFLSNPSEGIHHVAIVWSVDVGSRTGAGQIIESQDFNVPVHVRKWRGIDEPEVMPYAVRLAG
ncbi:MAG TPA: NlpC/P60 family protein [Jatrophihabitantaceae bacterium]|nr:NlpC/P60 family protein [Jatrophihabitantaceae bacterium]